MASACSVGSAVQIYVGLSVELIKTSQRGNEVISWVKREQKGTGLWSWLTFTIISRLFSLLAEGLCCGYEKKCKPDVV